MTETWLTPDEVGEPGQHSTPTAWLTPEEVGMATGTAPTSWKTQCKRLAMMGVPFRPNFAGRPLVDRSLYFATTPKPKAKPQPNWSAIRGPSA